MITRVERLQRKQENGESGFTLIELLVVVVIIGILVAIAVPLFLNYRKGAADKAAQSDVRAAISALDQCHSEAGSFPTATQFNGTGSGACQVGKSDSTDALTYSAPGTGTNGAYRIHTKASNGSGKFYCFSNGTGGSIKSMSAAPNAANNSCTTT